MKSKQQFMNGPYHQRGVAALIISLVLLVTITFVVLYTSRSVLMEQKVSNNEYRSRLAFEAAEAGLEAAVGAIANGWAMITTVDADGNIANAIRETHDEAGVEINQVIFDVDNNGALSGNANQTTLVNGSTVSVVLRGSISDDLVRYNVTSTGVSDGGSARRVIQQVFVMVPPIPNLPDAPLLSRTAITIGGAAVITNPEGHSTIWAGTNVNVGNNNATSTSIANPTDPNYPNCLGGSVRCGVTSSSTASVQGLDIIGNDSTLFNLSETEFFANFLGDTPTNFRRTRTDVITTPANFPTYTGSASQDKVIWVDGNVPLQGNPVYGGPTNPALIVINGNLSISGNPVFNGMVYVTGNIIGGGNPTFNGALVVAGVGTTGGTISVNYNSQLLKLLNRSAGAPSGSSGSWRDW